jgi:redox-sensitive bicupin YhaK (pirin superfamily)
MTTRLRPAAERGHANHGWLDSHHSFSFAHYHDPRHMGFRALRVINDDTVKPGAGFDTHGHRDMEIVSYVIDGALAHADTIGTKGVIRRGDIQAMSAGTGIRHSEYNASDRDDVHFLQIWIVPAETGLPPAYDQRAIPDADKRDRLALVAGPAGGGAALTIHQDARLYASLLGEGRTLHHSLAAGRGAWVQVIDGALEVNGTVMGPGDGLAIEETADIALTAAAASEFLLFDLA